MMIVSCDLIAFGKEINAIAAKTYAHHIVLTPRVIPSAILRFTLEIALIFLLFSNGYEKDTSHLIEAGALSVKIWPCLRS